MELTGKADLVAKGNKGNNKITGNRGDNNIIGNSGKDILLGENGDDLLKAGNGDDLLNGGKGKDVLEGGKGKDTFVLALKSGADKIRDFEDGIDRFELSGRLEFDQLRIKASGQHTKIFKGRELLATIMGVDDSLIGVEDFI